MTPRVLAGRSTRGKHGSADAAEAYAHWCRVLEASGGVIPLAEPEVTIGKLAHKHRGHAMSYYRKRGKPTSFATMIARVMDLWMSHQGQDPVAEYGAPDLKRFREEVLLRLKVTTGPTKGKTPIEETINRYIGLVQQALSWGVVEGLVPEAVASSCDRLTPLAPGRGHAAPDRPKVEAVDDAVVERTPPHLPAVVAAMVRVQRLAGMRPAEVCAMRPKHLDRSGASGSASRRCRRSAAATRSAPIGRPTASSGAIRRSRPQPGRSWPS